jgi:hypothetical protein
MAMTKTSDWRKPNIQAIGFFPLTTNNMRMVSNDMSMTRRRNITNAESQMLSESGMFMGYSFLMDGK